MRMRLRTAEEHSARDGQSTIRPSGGSGTYVGQVFPQTPGTTAQLSHPATDCAAVRLTAPSRRSWGQKRHMLRADIRTVPTGMRRLAPPDNQSVPVPPGDIDLR